MDVVLTDEIRHVGLGYSYCRWKGDRETWDYYQALLPGNLTPIERKEIFSMKKAEEKRVWTMILLKN